MSILADTLTTAAALASITAFQWVTAGVALYGAVLASISLYLQRRDKRPDVRVKFRAAMGPIPGGRIQTLFSLEAQNHGSVDVYVHRPQLELDGDKIMVFPPGQFLQSEETYPCKLVSGQRCNGFLLALDLVHCLRAEGYRGRVKIKAFFPDQLGTRYYSKPFTFDINDWEQRALSGLRPLGTDG